MLILSLDCAGSGCGVCVWQDGNVLAAQEERMERGQDQRLMPLILDVIKKAGVKFETLDRIAVTRGPGSFTGLRIGLSAARGIGLASNKPVIGIDRFAIFHKAFKPSNQDHLVIINSRRTELYCRFYPASGPAHAPQMLTPEEIAAFLENKNVMISGDIQPDLFNNFQVLPEPEFVIAASIAAEADPKAEEYWPRPLYLRAPDVTMPKTPHVTGDQLSPLTINQGPILAELHATCFADAKWNAQQIQSSLALETTQGWGLFEGETMIGFVLCQIIPHQSEILTVCVHPSRRKLGYGEKLMRHAAHQAFAAGSALYLEVAADNLAALALYQKLGFQQTGRRPRYYQQGPTDIDAILLTLPAPT